MAGNLTVAGARIDVSSPGGFLIALLLGAGLVLVYHSYQVKRLESEVDRLLVEIEISNRERTFANGIYEQRNRARMAKPPEEK